MLENPLDSSAKTNIPKRMVRRFFDGGDADSLQAFNGKDLSSPARITFRIQNAKAAKHLGDAYMFTIPLGGMASFARAADEMAKEPKTPFSNRRIANPRDRDSEQRIQDYTARRMEGEAARQRHGNLSFRNVSVRIRTRRPGHEDCTHFHRSEGHSTARKNA